jgi:hypothetical protein
VSDSGAGKDLPRGVVIAVLVAALLVFGGVGAWRFKEMREEAAREAAAAAEAQEDERDPIRVPRWVDEDQVRYPNRFRTTWEDPAALAGLRDAEGLAELVAGAASDEQRARRLMSWTRAQWEPGTPSPYPPPAAEWMLSEIRSGRTGGFCAQYAFLLVQAAQAVGLPARNLTVRAHEVVEVWLADESRWTMIDPFYETQVFGPEGRSLSALEIHEAHRRGDHALGLSETSRLEESMEAYASRFDRFAAWLQAAFTSRPMNFTDLRRYKLHYEPLPLNPRWPALEPGSLLTRRADEISAPPVDFPGLD